MSVYSDIKHTVVHRAGSGHAKGLLWLIEQVPGRTHSADISDAFLEKTYWATYGLPFFAVSIPTISIWLHALIE